jgi:hypothetical protein
MIITAISVKAAILFAFESDRKLMWKLGVWLGCLFAYESAGRTADPAKIEKKKRKEKQRKAKKKNCHIMSLVSIFNVIAKIIKLDLLNVSCFRSTDISHLYSETRLHAYDSASLR